MIRQPHITDRIYYTFGGGSISFSGVDLVNIQNRKTCPNCRYDMLLIQWFQYNNPTTAEKMVLQRVRYGCLNCGYKETWKVVEVERAKAEIEPRGRYKRC
jgi:C4-type Zn-finger protein